MTNEDDEAGRRLGYDVRMKGLMMGGTVESREEGKMLVILE